LKILMYIKCKLLPFSKNQILNNMKTRLLLLSLFVTMGVLVSCGDDDSPKVDPLIAEWEVDEFELTDVPAEFNDIEGTRTSLYGENRYRIEFNDDFTYARELRFSTGDLDEEGEWERDGDEIELDPDDDFGLIKNFEIVENDPETLVLTAETSFILLPNDVVTDTVTTQASLDALFDEYGVSNFVTVIYRMEKN